MTKCPVLCKRSASLQNKDNNCAGSYADASTKTEYFGSAHAVEMTVSLRCSSIILCLLVLIMRIAMQLISRPPRSAMRKVAPTSNLAITSAVENARSRIRELTEPKLAFSEQVGLHGSLAARWMRGRTDGRTERRTEGRKDGSCILTTAVLQITTRASEIVNTNLTISSGTGRM